MLLTRRRYAPRTVPDEVHHTDAADGWRLALHRYRPFGDAPHAEPVLLVHGLGTCNKQFDLGVGTPDAPVPSLARWLAARGYDVWAPDLRGSGKSERPGRAQRRRWDWCLDDMVEQDVPALVDYVLARSEHRRLHWVGHSMGGILLLCHCALYGGAEIASGVVAAGGLDYSMCGSRYRMFEPLKPLGRLVRRVPSGALARTAAPLFGRVSNPVESTFFHPANIASAAARALVAGTQYDVSGEVLYQLASLFQPGGLRSRDERHRYADRMGDIDTPILLMAGEKDQQCAPAVAEHTRGLLPGPQPEVLVFGKTHGQREHYGHFDLFAGLHAEFEVFPHLRRWFSNHPVAPRAVSG